MISNSIVVCTTRAERMRSVFFFILDWYFLDELVNPENAAVQCDCCIEFHFTGDVWWWDPVDFNGVWSISEDFLVCHRILCEKTEIKTFAINQSVNANEKHLKTKTAKSFYLFRLTRNN